MIVMRKTTALHAVIGSCGACLLGVASSVSHESPDTLTTSVEDVWGHKGAAGKLEIRIETMTQAAALAAETAKDKATTAALKANAATGELSGEAAVDIQRAAAEAYEAAEESSRRSGAAHSRAIMTAPGWALCAQDTARKAAAGARQALTAARTSARMSMQSDKEVAARAARRARAALQQSASMAVAAASAATGLWNEEMSKQTLSASRTTDK